LNTKDDAFSRPRPLDDKNEKSDKNNEGRKKFKGNEEEAQNNPPNVIQID
jgi:hypothetical protein